MDSDDLSPAEAARERRRDRDMESHARAGMKTGLAKQFKQVLDAQVKRAKGVDRTTAETKAPAEQRTKRKPRADG